MPPEAQSGSAFRRDVRLFKQTPEGIENFGLRRARLLVVPKKVIGGAIHLVAKGQRFGNFAAGCSPGAVALVEWQSAERPGGADVALGGAGSLEKACVPNLTAYSCLHGRGIYVSGQDSG